MANATWPNFFVVGAPKAGTSSISTALMQHPQVFKCAVKEPNFFNPDLFIEDIPGPLPMHRPDFHSRRYHFAIIRDEATYLRLYSKSDGFTAIGDYSAHYLQSKVAAGAIHRRVPGAKIIICLRQPSARAYSHFLMDCRVGRATPPFSRVIARHIRELNLPVLDYENYVDGGMYYQQVKRYLAMFGPHAVHIVLYDDLVVNFECTIREILQFLALPSTVDIRDVRENSASLARFSALNRLIYKTGMRRWITRHIPARIKKLAARHYYYNSLDHRIEPRDDALLKDFFRDDISKLQTLIGRDLTHWL